MWTGSYLLRLYWLTQSVLSRSAASKHAAAALHCRVTQIKYQKPNSTFSLFFCFFIAHSCTNTEIMNHFFSFSDSQMNIKWTNDARTTITVNCQPLGGIRITSWPGLIIAKFMGFSLLTGTPDPDTTWSQDSHNLPPSSCIQMNLVCQLRSNSPACVPAAESRSECSWVSALHAETYAG